MTVTGFFWHFANFIAPALWLGLGLAIWNVWASRNAARISAAFRHWWRGLLLDWVTGIAVLLAALVITGHDGRVLTYGVLALTMSARRCCWP